MSPPEADPDPVAELRAEVSRLRALVDTLSVHVRGTSPYAEDDPVLPPLPPIREHVKSGGPNIDAYRYWLRDVVERGDEGRYERVLRDPWPIPDTANREGYCGGDHIAFWLSGLADHLKAVETAARHGVTGGRFYEFGGGAGRVYRHFAAQSDAWEVWASDFRLSSVRWALQHFPPQLRVFGNTAQPSLPLPDGAFDLVAAFSVFTHIDQAETQWLMELRRILRPGGLAYLSIHDEETWRSEDTLRRRTAASCGLDPDGPLPEGKTVAHWRKDDPYSCNVFHSRGYLRSVWGRYFELLEVKPAWVGAQAAVVLRRVD